MRFTRKYERPEWVDRHIESRRTWILYDSSTDRLKTGRAENQREAIKKALAQDIVPRDTHDVVPRQGSYREVIMSPEEFDEFMQTLMKG